MFASFSKLAVALGVFSLAQAAPATSPSTSSMLKRSFDCSSPVSGLTTADCQHMSDIGFVSQGVNPTSDNGAIWIGSDGPNTFTFENTAGVDVTLVIWNQATGASFVSANQPAITYSIADQDSVEISMDNSVSGGWAGLYNQITTLNEAGSVYNTWGEFTTGDYATVDVSREPNMGGNAMSITLDSGCVSDMNTCVFECISGNTCYESGTYSLVNCANGSQPGATIGSYDDNPTGGCQGFNDGGHMTITFSN
ncbi:MAG: hypothetical protein M1818_005756 [Claussenomyces sp. TS43310]|nr:MAG: hypothetical protein M1818_005756 [Claussenomyces sp. TS43310]